MPAPAPALDLLADEAAYRAYVRRYGPPGREFFAALADTLAQEARSDPSPMTRRAERLVELANASGEAANKALAWRALGNIAFLRGDYAEAVEQYRQALLAFGKDDLERGRTLSSLLHPLALLGNHEASMAAAEEARACFERCGARHRLARLEINLASVWFRADRHAEALAALDRAQTGLEASAEGGQDHEAWAAILVTRAVVLINLARFEEAEEAYQAARDYSLAHQLPGLAAQADYNIGYLYFLRGQYVKAIRALDRARETAASVGDKMHLALCDLDQSDVCLELNLHEDALKLAHAALGQFEALALPYERGKALANMAMAEQFLGHDSNAMALLLRAEEAFVAGGSEFWVAMIGLYRAGVLLQWGRCFEAMQLSERARVVFEGQQARTKAIYADILTARAHLTALDHAGAKSAAERAATALSRLHAPWLQGQIQYLLGQLAEGEKDRQAALAAYDAAMVQAEATRGHVNFDELRLAFLRDKSRLYERYLELLLDSTPPPEPEAVWRHIERAKSRSLALVMAAGFGAIEQRAGEGSRVVQEIGRLREELNWYYRQLDPNQRDGAGAQLPVTGVEAVLQAIQQRERQLLRAIRELPDDQYRILEQDAEVALEKLRPHLARATLVEYFHCAQGYVAVVADQERMEVVRLPGERAGIEAALRLLRFQVGQRAMESDHFRRHARAFQHATESHLRLLRRELVAPLVHLLRHEQTLIVPHGVLHALPFAAVPAGTAGQPLAEAQVLALAPNAAVFLLCNQRLASPYRGALVIAAEPVAAAAEIGAVRRYQPHAMVLAGETATVAAVRTAAQSARLLHIAAHGAFRTQNPYFSGLDLADGRLNVIDIYNLRLAADLVVLTGCGAALGDFTRGDELIGLARAFLYAGARAVITSLWDVDDRTTAEFMMCFYDRWNAGRTAAQALRQATLELRRRYAHPFFWAPFQLLGSLD